MLQTSTSHVNDASNMLYHANNVCYTAVLCNLATASQLWVVVTLHPIPCIFFHCVVS